MREAPDGWPMIGASAKILGARPGSGPGTDIPMISGHIITNTGGMSVSSGSPFNIDADYCRLVELGGTQCGAMMYSY